MSIERKDLRIKVDHDIHAGLSLLADCDEKDIAEWCEVVLAAEVRRRIHAATVIAERASRLGIAGTGRES